MPSAAEIALNEAAGKRLIHLDGEPIWIMGGITMPGNPAVRIDPIRRTGSDGADEKGGD